MRRKIQGGRAKGSREPEGHAGRMAGDCSHRCIGKCQTPVKVMEDRLNPKPLCGGKKGICGRFGIKTAGKRLKRRGRAKMGDPPKAQISWRVEERTSGCRSESSDQRPRKQKIRDGLLEKRSRAGPMEAESATRRRLIAILRRVAMTWGPLPVRVVHVSSLKTVSRTQ